MLINVQVQIVPRIYAFAAESLFGMLVNIHGQYPSANCSIFLAFFKKSSNLRQ